MNNFVDLHLHTTCSDGSYSAEEIIDSSIRLGLTHIAFTDHDSIKSVVPAREYSARVNGPEIIPAIEFSSFYKTEDVHILAYYIPIENPRFLELIDKIQKLNIVRLQNIIKALSDLDIPITLQDLPESFEGCSFMCPQIAKCLINKGYISSGDEAAQFVRKFMQPGGPAFFYHENSPEEIISLMNELECVTSLAHPHKMNDLNLIDSMIDMGINGLEFYYPNLGDDNRHMILSKAIKHNLLLTGGSDFHGEFSTTEIGQGNVPESVIDDMKAFLDI